MPYGGPADCYGFGVVLVSMSSRRRYERAARLRVDRSFPPSALRPYTLSGEPPFSAQRVLAGARPAVPNGTPPEVAALLRDLTTDGTPPPIVCPPFAACG